VAVYGEFHMAAVRPCATSDAAGIAFYDIPSLGIRTQGIGGRDENMTGPGSGTVVGQVLHTLRPR
jgi:hypothetical protein